MAGRQVNMRLVVVTVLAMASIVISDTEVEREILESEHVDAPVAAALVRGDDADYGECDKVIFVSLIPCIIR